MRTFEKWLLIAAGVPAACLSLLAATVAGHAADAMHTKTVGDYRIELYVLPAEPFFSKADVAAKNVKEGMEIEGGAAPVAPDADSIPIITSICTSSPSRPAKWSPTQR